MDTDSLRDAYTLSLERFDLQYTFLTTERFLGEQVTIHTSQRERASSLVVLPQRDQELQVSMRAHNEGGENLVLLSRDRLEALYRDVFETALTHLATWDERPAPLTKLIEDPAPWDDFFEGRWFDDLKAKPEVRAQVEGHLRDVFEGVGEVVTDEEAATEAFIDFVIKHLDESYRPCVLLDQPLGGRSGRQAALVKYEVEGAVGLAWWKRLTEAVLGFVPLQVEFGYETLCSSHLRLRSPEGMVFNHPVRAPPGCTRFHPGRQELQTYYSREDAQALATGDVEAGQGLDGAEEGEQKEEGERGIADTRARLTQTASTRAIVGALFLLVAIAPIPFGWAGADGMSAAIEQLWESRTAPWSETVIGQVDLDAVEATVQSSLPLAILLVALAWDRPPVRPFAVTQLILSLLVLGAWLVGTGAPAVAQAAVFGGLGLAAYNLLEAALFVWPLSRRGWYD